MSVALEKANKHFTVSCHEVSTNFCFPRESAAAVLRRCGVPKINENVFW
jgi:hypothetical protein